MHTKDLHTPPVPLYSTSGPCPVMLRCAFPDKSKRKDTIQGTLVESCEIGEGSGRGGGRLCSIAGVQGQS